MQRPLTLYYMLIHERTKMLLTEIANLGKKMHLKSNHTLIHYKEKVDSIFIVENGGVILYATHPTNFKERAVNFSIQNYNPLLTAVYAYFFNKTSDYTIKTFTKSEVIEVKRSIFEQFITDNNLREEYNRYAISKFIEMNELRTWLITLNSQEMMEHLNLHYPQIIKQIPAKYIANFLGITPEWYSKLRKKVIGFHG